LRELGIGLTAYGVLSRGLISGHWSKAREGDGDFRSINPRFQGENLDKNLELVEKLREEARAKGVTVAQLAIAWVLAKGKDIVPLLGARERVRLDEVLGALAVELGPFRRGADRAHRPAGHCRGYSIQRLPDRPARQQKS
jgi:aryl-alcohol dehydrogenase-like predicted oxidoreductase